ncbi:MAG: 2,3-bisphosphoglycerate-independent phosphoglycerate mutase [Syntrophomonadaceae bacterium]|jgi:2,3-bisphosphoglycerate-independent phosphoglycerate mutase|nr:2,3-bisphosphoglycerate-independent phosphoglycerate mutase [Syntrophomonadaceae bacterium]
MIKKPFVLMILDGWGEREAAEDNAVTLADPVNFCALKHKYPYTLLRCCGLDVGLPGGQMGNSEVGHLNIGSGRVVYQELTRISKDIAEGSFYENEKLLEAINSARQNNRAVHLLGLVSDGSVHSAMEHIYALLKMCKINQMKKVFIHAFLDGRDVAPQSAGNFIAQLEDKMSDLGIGKVSTMGGRFYGMDRDKHWDRVAKAYKAMVLGEGRKFVYPQAAITASYEEHIYDEFIEPVVIVDENAQPVGLLEDQDSIIFFNFRADRARQITRAFVEADFKEFERIKWPQVYFAGMTQYDEKSPAAVAFLPQNLTDTLGEVLAQNHMRQLRIAETEKYAHVTFFFNGGLEKANDGEDRILINSPQVETYNMKPEMSAYEITERVLAEMKRNHYDVIIINYANADMVGHTGVLSAAVQAVKAVDECLKKVVDLVLELDGSMIITADHGNCEMMVHPETKSPLTSHTLSLVPFILISSAYENCQLRDDAALCDIAPTILNLLKLKKPPEMTGRDIIK